MSDYTTETLRYLGPNDFFNRFVPGRTYTIRYRLEQGGVLLLLGDSDPKQNTYLMTEAEFADQWVTP